MKKRIITGVLILASLTMAGQSKNFKTSKWLEVHSAIIRELGRSYVDTLDIDRIERAGIDAMLEELDPYTVYIPEEENENLEMMISKTYGGIGAVIYKPEKSGNVIINEPYEGSPAVMGGLECGDEIMEIDGVSVNGLTSAECSERMRGEPDTKVVFKVKKLRSGSVKDISITRKAIRLPDIEYYGMLDDSTGYILQSGFTQNVSSQLRQAVLDMKDKGMKRLVYDLRNNGGGLLIEAVNIVSLFVPKGTTVVTAKGRDDSMLYSCKTENKPIDTELPIIVLVNSGSASSSEIVSGALQDLDRATIMGTKTYGKGLVQSIQGLPYGGELKLTSAKYYTPSGRCVQAIDYTRRNEDGSVGQIPDSLTHEFRTAHGRIVRDGGGIKPDVEIKGQDYSRLTYSLVMNGIVEQFALDFVRRHTSIGPADDFSLGDEEYEKFVDFAKDKKFDYRSSAKTFYDIMKEEIEKDGLSELMADQLAALDKGLNIGKEEFLRLKKDEIIPFIEEEIIVRYHFQAAGAKHRLKYDGQLKKALSSPLIDCR